MSPGWRCPLWRRVVAAVEDMLQVTILVLALLAGGLVMSDVRVTGAQVEFTAPLLTYRVELLEKQMAKVHDDLSTQNKLLIAVLAAVVTNMGVYVLTRRRERRGEGGVG